MTNTYTPRRSTEQWQSLVDQWQSSGQSAKQFCKDQALGYASFCQWRKRLTHCKRLLYSVLSSLNIAR